MSSLALAKKETFGNVECDFWRDKDTNDFFMTREQIGNALGYENPRESIKTIHQRNKDRLDKFSRRVQIDTPLNGGKQTSTLYSYRGIYEICRWSRQPKADAFMDFVWDTIETIRTNKISIYLHKELDQMLNEKFGILETSIDKKLVRLKADFGKVLYLNKGKEKEQKPDYSTFVHDTVKPLAEKHADISKGYTVTLRQVYARMGVGWTYRQTRYMRQHKLKHPPKKINLVTRDKNLRKLFKRTVEIMLNE